MEVIARNECLNWVGLHPKLHHLGFISRLLYSDRDVGPGYRPLEDADRIDHGKAWIDELHYPSRLHCSGRRNENLQELAALLDAISGREERMGAASSRSRVPVAGQGKHEVSSEGRGVENRGKGQ